ncbi:hypothetical protein WUBG_15573 [Wuchereria bancrofti]|uniref:Uncharacterized protein n=1 Tax=Wuchereria bancrofti TaxID=6293 RepID=J9EDM9_WUCBA|nr:hypothetical protein WUBG_15573 [Wuchereria bancrofti]
MGLFDRRILESVHGTQKAIGLITCNENSQWISTEIETEYLQLERYGYLHTTAATKLAILKALCESQFDFNVKFKESLLNSCAASDLRLLPIGYDKEGLAYLYQQDADLVIRIYSAEQDDHSGGSWNLVVKVIQSDSHSYGQLT